MSEQPAIHTESIVSPEEARKHELYFSALAITEMHAMTYALMATEHGPFSRSDLHKSFMAAQGEKAVWKPSNNLNFEYSHDKFEPAGLTKVFTEIRNLENRKKPTPVLVTETALEGQDASYALAVAGVLMNWSLKDGTPAIREVFGESRTGAHGGGGTIIKRNILEAVLAQPGISEIEVAEFVGKADPRLKAGVNNQLLDYLKNGILHREDASDWVKREFELTGEGFKHQTKERESLADETKAIYDMADVLVATGREKITADEFYRLTLESFPGLDVSKLQRRVKQALAAEHHQTKNGNPTKNIPVLRTAGAFNEGKRTTYYVNPEFKDSIQELLTELDRVDSGDAEIIDHYTDRAMDIISNPAAVQKLTKKALEASPQKNLLTEKQFLQKIDEVLISEGPMSFRAVAAALKEQGIRMTNRGVEAKLKELAISGQIIVEQLPRDHKTNVKVQYVTGLGSHA